MGRNWTALLLAALILSAACAPSAPPTNTPAPTKPAAAVQSPEPTSTPVPASPMPAAPTSSPVPPSPSATPCPTFRVGNTGGEGAYIRRSPGTDDKDRLKAWPDGTPMQNLCAPVEVAGERWEKVKDPDGREGFVKGIYLVADRTTVTPAGTPAVSSTPARTTTPSPASVRPTATNTVAPTRAPTNTSGAGVTITKDPGTVAPRGTASVSARAAPGTPCTIVVNYRTGPSTAQGLGPKTTDASGNVSWSWTVGSNTTPGSWPVTVTCGGASAKTEVVVP